MGELEEFEERRGEEFVESVEKLLEEREKEGFSSKEANITSPTPGTTYPTKNNINY